jgi:Autographiviridae endonuclease VII
MREYNKNNPEVIKNANLRRYNITLDEYEIILKNQNGVCKVCKKSETHKRHKYLAVDHDHKTKKIRGLLCSRCNMALGLLKEDINIIESLTNYLRSSKDGEC